MITFTKGQTYWLENPKYGTLRATLVIRSPNNESLGFNLEQLIAHKVKWDNGMTIGRFLPLMNEGGVFTDIISQERWTIYDTEPANKLPTK